MTRPLLYDVFCGGGGCTKGYQQAGFRVIGIDSHPQPHYCGDGFMQMDAFEFFRRYMSGEYEPASAFHCSPPCQGYSNTRVINGHNYPMLIEPVRAALMATGRPYIIENVVGAPLLNAVMLSGTMFDLGTVRERLFECSFQVELPLAPTPGARHTKMGRQPEPGKYMYVVGHVSDVKSAGAAMGIDWMNRDELAEAIPPDYTTWIGAQLLQHLEVSR